MAMRIFYALNRARSVEPVPINPKKGRPKATLK